MKIALVLPPRFTFSQKTPNSIETVIRAINAGSRFKGELTIVCDEGQDCGVAFRVVKVPAYKNAGTRLKHMGSVLAQIKPDLLEIHQHAPSGYKLAAASGGVPSVLYRHNVVKEAKNTLTKWRHRRRYAAFDGHIFVSAFARDSFVRAFPVFAQSSYAVPNPIEVADWFSPTTSKENIITFAGRAAPDKGIEPLAKALATTLKNYPEWRAELAFGAWQVHRKWAEEVTHCLLPFGDRCLLHRNLDLDDVKQLLQRSKVAVVPSIVEEAFGLAAIEAHAAGCAVISSGRGGLREASGSAALYLQDVTTQQIEKGLTTLLGSPALLDQLAQAGLDYARTHHSVAKRAAELDDVRERIVASACA